MKKSNFTETQILAIVAEAESGRKIHDICREHRITQATFYNCRLQLIHIDSMIDRTWHCHGVYSAMVMN